MTGPQFCLGLEAAFQLEGWGCPKDFGFLCLFLWQAYHFYLDIYGDVFVLLLNIMRRVSNPLSSFGAITVLREKVAFEQSLEEYTEWLRS